MTSFKCDVDREPPQLHRGTAGPRRSERLRGVGASSASATQSRRAAVCIESREVQLPTPAYRLFGGFIRAITPGAVSLVLRKLSLAHPPTPGRSLTPIRSSDDIRKARHALPIVPRAAWGEPDRSVVGLGFGQRSGGRVGGTEPAGGPNRLVLQTADRRFRTTKRDSLSVMHAWLSAQSPQKNPRSRIFLIPLSSIIDCLGGSAREDDSQR